MAVADCKRVTHIVEMVLFVVPHDPKWNDAFADEAEAIKDALGDTFAEIYHIGSTAVPGILAKPIIDLLGVVSSLAEIDVKTGSLERLGYEAMGAYGIEGRRYFRKISNEDTRTHHLHVFEKGSLHVERHLAFRDYLVAHPKVAEEYSALKERLTEGVGNTWDRYLDGKAPFVSCIEPQAVDWFRKTNQ